MKKTITKTMLLLAVLFGVVVGASAKKLYADLSKVVTCDGVNATWDGSTNTITWTGTGNNMVSAFDFGLTTKYQYQNGWDSEPFDISAYTTFNITVSNLTEGCTGIRVQMKAYVGGSIQEVAWLWAKAGKTTLNLADFKNGSGTANLSRVVGIRILGGNDKTGSCSISDVYLEGPDDPLALPKANLKALIDKYSLRSNYALTDASYTLLQTRLTEANTAYNTAESVGEVNTAKDNLQAAYDALELLPGYTRLTKAMFKYYGDTDPHHATTGTVDGNCEYHLFEKLNDNSPYYGLNGVDWNRYADLSMYEKLEIVVVGTEGGDRPRPFFNRLVNGAGDDGSTTSNAIDFNAGNGVGDARQAAYQTIVNDGHVYVFNIKKIVEDKINGSEFAHLHVIKSLWGGTKTITDLLLYDPLLSYKNELRNAITRGKAYNVYGKTTDSWNALTNAINHGEDLLAGNAMTEENLTLAKNAIETAIENLEMTDGYVNLTIDMFKQYTSMTDDARYLTEVTGKEFNKGVEVSTAHPNDVIFGLTGGGVDGDKFADLTGYNSIYIYGTGGRARMLFNRNDGDTRLTDTGIDAVSGTINGSLDLTTLEGKSENCDYVHLNSIKARNANVTIYEIILQSDPVALTVGEAGYTTFSSTNKNVRMSGVTAYAAQYDGTKIVLTEIEKVPAGTGVIVKADANNYSLPVVDKAASITNNDLLVSDGTVVGDGSSIFALAKGASGVGFYKVKSGVTIPAGKAYLSLPSTAREFISFDGEETTAIKSIGTTKTEKTIFNLNGQRMTQPVKGLNIVSGKKVVLK